MAIKVTTTGQTTFVKKIILGTPIRSVVQTTGTLVGLQDVTLTNKRHDEFLRYDSGSGQFVNTDSATLNNLSVSTNLATGKVASDLIPSQDSAFDLGSSTNKWKDLFLSGNTISLGSIQLKDSSGGLVVVDSDGTPSKLSVGEIRGLFSASGDLTYNSSTGVFQFDVEQVYTKDNFDSDFNDALDSAALGGTGLTFNSASNTLDITNTGVVAATYGSASEVPVLKINAQGQIDSAGSTQVAGVTSVAFDSASQNFTISTADGGTFVKMISNRMPSASAGAYGSASKVPIVTVNQYGLVDSIGTTLVAGVTGFTYDSSSGLLTISTADGNTFTDSINLNPFNTSTLSEGTNLYYTTARSDSDFDIRLATKSTTNLSEGNNLYYTTTRVDSAFDARFDSSFDERLATKSTNNLSEGNNLYYTTARADSAFDTRFDSSFDERLATKSTTNLSEGSNLYFTTGRADARVNLQTGANLDLSSKSTSDLSEGTNLYFTTARADSDAKNAISGGTGISYNSSTGSITTNDAQIDHDTLSNFVLNEHINHSNVSIIAGSGLLGGGDLTSSRTINIDSANVRVMFSGETGVTYNNANGEISIGQDVGTSANVTFNQVRGPAEFIIDPATIGDNSGTVRILGNLTVEGTTTTINSTEVSVNDKTFRIADSAADSSGLAGAGIVFGGASITANKPSFKYNHAQERFDFNRKISADGSALTNIPAGQLTGTIDNARISLDAAEIPNLAASKITSGLLDSARLQPLNINASYVSTGTLEDARIPNLAASKITSGLFDSARLQPLNINASYVSTGTLEDARIPNLAASKITSGLFDSARLQPLAMNASYITTGTIDDARLPASISSDITGNAATATTATTATNVTVADESTDTSCFPLFVTAATGDLAPKSGSNLTFNSSSGKLGATTFSGSGAGLTNLDASALSGGTVPSARLSLSSSDIPNLAASKITSGLFDSARIPPIAMNASYITTGTFTNLRTSDSAIFDGDGASGGISLSDGLIDIRTGTGLVSQIRFYCEDNNAHFQTLQAAPHIAGSSAVIVLPTASGTLLNTDGSGASLTNLNASQLSSGTVPSARLSLSASDIPNLAASKITSGLFDSARLQPLAMNASYITTGTLAEARIPNLAASKITSGSLDSSILPLGVSFHGAGGGGGGTATDITISANNSTDESVFLTFVDGATGTQGLETDTSLTYNPSTNTLSIGAGGDALTIDDAGTITANGNTLVLNSTSATALQHNGSTKLQTGSGGIDVNGSVIVGTGDTFTLDGSETTTSSTSQTALVTVAKATYGAAKFLVTAVSSSERHITEIYATHDGTTGVATEYGTVTTNGILATYDVDINGDNFRLLATPASSTSTTFKVVQTLIEA